MTNALRVKYCKSILFNIFFQGWEVNVELSILGAWIYMKNVGIYPKQFLVSKTRLYNRIPFQYIYNSTIFQKKNVSPSALSFVDWKENSLYLRPQSFKVSHEEFVHSLCTSASGCQHISLKLCISPIHIKKEWKWKIHGCKTKNRKRESLEIKCQLSCIPRQPDGR